MTRVTPSMLSANYLTNMRRNLNNMQKIQSQLSTGKEISKPSDNPYKVSRTMQLYTEIDANKQFNENIKDVSNWLDATDTGLDQINNILARTRELQVKAGNGTYKQEEHLALQSEIKEKVNQLADVLNSNFDGAYIFGGTKSTSKPVIVDDNGQIQYADKDGNPLFPIKDGVTGHSIDSIIKNEKTGMATVKYTDLNIPQPAPPAPPIPLQQTDIINITPPAPPTTEEDMIKDWLTQATVISPVPTIAFSTATIDKAGDSYAIMQGQINGDLNVEVSQGVFINYNRTAVNVLEYKDSSNNTNSVSELLNNIIYNLNDPQAKDQFGALLYTNPTPDVSKVSGDYLTQMDSAISNLLQRRSEVGAMSNRASSAEANNDKQNEGMTDILSKTEDIDFTEKMMQYSMLQTVYTASLQVSAKVLPMTILNYL